MTTNYHTAIVNGDSRGNDAAIWNGPLSSLDAAISTISGAGGRFTNANGAASAGQKVLTVDSSSGLVAGANVVYTLVGGVIETNTIATVDSGTQITLTDNIGTGGVPDNGVIAQVTPDAAAIAVSGSYGNGIVPTAADRTRWLSEASINAESFGLATTNSGAQNATAMETAIAYAVANGITRIMIPAGRYALDEVDVSDGAYYGLAFEGYTPQKDHSTGAFSGVAGQVYIVADAATVSQRSFFYCGTRTGPNRLFWRNLFLCGKADSGATPSTGSVVVNFGIYAPRSTECMVERLDVRYFNRSGIVLGTLADVRNVEVGNCVDCGLMTGTDGYMDKVYTNSNRIGIMFPSSNKCSRIESNGNTEAAIAKYAGVTFDADAVFGDPTKYPYSDFFQFREQAENDETDNAGSVPIATEGILISTAYLSNEALSIYIENPQYGIMLQEIYLNNANGSATKGSGIKIVGGIGGRTCQGVIIQGVQGIGKGANTFRPNPLIEIDTVNYVVISNISTTTWNNNALKLDTVSYSLISNVLHYNHGWTTSGATISAGNEDYGIYTTGGGNNLYTNVRTINGVGANAKGVLLATSDMLANFSDNTGTNTLPNSYLGTASSRLNGSLRLASFCDFAEMTTPGGSVDIARLFARDNGSGKTQLCVIFGNGGIGILSTEP